MSRPNTFSMDKEKIADQVEIIMQELIPQLTGKKVGYKLVVK
jgi:hypothetical protein